MTEAEARADSRAAALVLGLAAALTALRVAALFLSPLQLYPDEAQYWLWSRTLSWGYVSKPPMIAWLIWTTTQLGGNGEPWVRLAAPFAHLIPMLALWRVGRRLYGGSVGVLAAVLYALMPAVQVSALFIATDAPLLAFMSLSLWAYVGMVQARTGGARRLAAAAFGLTLGLAFLAKFAAVYFVMGAAIHAAVSREARRAWGGWAWAVVLAALLAAFGPNLAWQASNGFATVAHTTEVNAHWTPASMFHLGKLVEFVVGQFGVLGPIPFAVLVAGTVALARRRALEPADRLLLAFVAPALVLVTIQAFISRAHAHWAAASYLPGVVLASAWLLRWRARGWIAAGVALQGAVAAVVLVVFAFPVVADATGNARRLQRQRGWDRTAELVVTAARAVPGLAAVAVEDRYMFNELAYYGRDYFAEAGSAPLRMRPPPGRALNEAELAAPLRPQPGGRVLVAETPGRPAVFGLPREFDRVRRLGRWSIELDPGHARVVELWLGEGYRGPVSGVPTEP
jgi:4-amino-4-deoxy-L-arabinose transferase-like glycosyltransferase